MDSIGHARRPEEGDDDAVGGAGPRTLIVVAVTLALVGAVYVVLANAAATSSARVAASTEGRGLLAAGDIVLERADSSAALLLDADGLYPGLEVRGCVVLVYEGTVPATIRLHGDSGAGTGLDRYVQVRIDARSGDICPQASPPGGRSAPAVFIGRLSSLSSLHSSYARGAVVGAEVRPGESLVVEAVATVVEDNRAQGLTTDFSLTFEARPA